MTRRRLLTGASAAAVALVAWPSPRDVFPVPPGGLATAEGSGRANRRRLVELLAKTPVDGTLDLPAGVFPVDLTDGPVPVPHGLTIQGATPGVTALDVFPKDPARQLPQPRGGGSKRLAPLFLADGAPDGSFVQLRDLTVYGPTTGGRTVEQSAVVQWFRAPDGTASSGHLRLERVDVVARDPDTGGRADPRRLAALFGAGVQYSLKGRLEVIDCDINAWEAPVKSFESTAEPDGLTTIVRGGTHSGFHSKSDSIGIYIHPHVNFRCTGTRYREFGRFAFYANGSPSPSPTFWEVTDVEVTNCGVAQTATHAHARFERVRNTGRAVGGAPSLLKGQATFVDCDLRLDAPINVGRQADVTRRFQGCWFEPAGILLSAGKDTGGTLEFVDCTWKLADHGRALNLPAGWSGDVRFTDSSIHDCGTTGPYLVQVQGGRLDYGSLTVDSPRPDHGLVVGPDVAVTGAPELHDEGDCPASPGAPTSTSSSPSTAAEAGGQRS